MLGYIRPPLFSSAETVELDNLTRQDNSQLVGSARARLSEFLKFYQAKAIETAQLNSPTWPAVVTNGPVAIGLLEYGVHNNSWWAMGLGSLIGISTGLGIGRVKLEDVERKDLATTRLMNLEGRIGIVAAREGAILQISPPAVQNGQ